MAGYLVRGILIGLIFGLPVGAVGAMTVQRTLTLGLKAGLLTGLGSSVADCFYAIVGAFGLTLISDLLLKHQIAIHVCGGALLLLMGVRLFFSKHETVPVISATGNVKLFLSSFAIGITNPAAILTFLFAFSYFGVAEVAQMSHGTALVFGVFIGTYLWWGAISFASYKVKQRAATYHLGRGNKIFGTMLALLGAIILAQSVIGNYFS